MNRRSLSIGLGSALFAPAIVRASSLMPVRAIDRLVLPSELIEPDPARPASWGTVLSFELFDAPTAGKLLLRAGFG
jgi:hypothetical protein